MTIHWTQGVRSLYYSMFMAMAGAVLYFTQLRQNTLWEVIVFQALDFT